MPESDKYITNSNMDGYLTIGRSFFVFGLRFFENITYIYIFDDEHLIEVPLELFEIIDNKISYQLEVKVWHNGELTLWPKLFYEDNFIENHAEREKKERQQFEELRKKIEI